VFIVERAVLQERERRTFGASLYRLLGRKQQLQPFCWKRRGGP